MEKLLEEDSRDYYYNILGVNRLATQHEITEAYERLAYAHDPDRNNGTSNDLEAFQKIAKAFQILSDPNKRIQYDREGIIRDDEEYSGLDVQSLGGLGRVFGAMISRFGVPLQTQVSQETLQTATQICSNGGIIGSGAPLDNRVTDLVWGWSVDGRVARQDAIYYRITVDQIKSKNGFIIFCRSLTGKFKLVLFDSNGEVIHIDESIRTRDGSQWESALYFLSAFSMYKLPPTLPASFREQDLPPVFNSLDSFTQCNMSLPAGQYLVCVYGDNFIGKTSYSLLAVPTLNDCQEAQDVQELDKSLVQAKESLSKFQVEYLQAKEAYEKALKRVQNETDRVEVLIEKREYSYGAFMIASANAFLPTASSDSSFISRHTNDNPNQNSIDSTSTASINQTVYQVANTVASASGWMASTFTSGFGTLNRLIGGETLTETSNQTPSAHEQILFDDDDDDDDNNNNNNNNIQSKVSHLSLSSVDSSLSTTSSTKVQFEEIQTQNNYKDLHYNEQDDDDEDDEGDEDHMIGVSTHSTNNLI